MRTVAVLALHGVLPFDLGIACEAFTRIRSADGSEAYRVRICGEAKRVRASAFEFTAPWRFDEIAQADTVIVPGIENIARPVPPPVLDAIRSAFERGARIASICTGAFVLAAAGLLDGRRATTHWLAAGELARRFPAVTVDPDVLFVDDGRIITSAGASAGLDMCLHLIRRDHGQAIAAQAARLAVAPLHRDGGQAQFIRHSAPMSATSLAPLLDWMLDNLHRPLDIASLAERARLTPRTFARRFRQQTGTTPLQWLFKCRIRRTQELLETSSASIDRIAAAAGFGSPVTFRARFQRFVGLSPTAYRRRFSAPGEAAGKPA
jgi:transcriptional regulator GlxA family with amidase domain